MTSPLGDRHHRKSNKHNTPVTNSRIIQGRELVQTTTMADMSNMSEITTAKYNENTIDRMVTRYNEERLNGGWNMWELNQTWKATRLDGVRILHAYKRKKTVFQGNLTNAKEMIRMLEAIVERDTERREYAKQCNKGDQRNKSTQTDDDWLNYYRKNEMPSPTKPESKNVKRKPRCI